MKSQMIRVISSPSSSTTGFSTLILDIGFPLMALRRPGTAAHIRYAVAYRRKGGMARRPWRWRKLGLATLLCRRPRGIFIPYRHADAIPEPAPGHPELEPIFEAAQGDFAALLDRIDAHAEALAAFDGPAPEPRWTQTWF